MLKTVYVFLTDRYGKNQKTAILLLNNHTSWMFASLLMLCEFLGLDLDLAFGSVTSESESVLHSMSLSVY